MELSVYSHFFSGFGYSAILPTVVGVFVGIKRALWASAFSET